MDNATQQLGDHLEAFIYRVPKKNHDAIVQNLKKFVPWFEKNGVKIEYYQFGNSEAMEGFESIDKALSVSGDEEIWMELQYFRDLQHSRGFVRKDDAGQGSRATWKRVHEPDHAGEEPRHGRVQPHEIADRSWPP